MEKTKTAQEKEGGARRMGTKESKSILKRRRKRWEKVLTCWDGGEREITETGKL